MLASVRDFLRRQTVIELACAFAIATATVWFLQAAARGFVITPITTPQREIGGINPFGSGWFVLGGRLFTWVEPLSALIVLALVLPAVVLILKVASRHSERPLRDCPHCLESIPAAASVCSYCTRDIAPV